MPTPAQPFTAGTKVRVTLALTDPDSVDPDNPDPVTPASVTIAVTRGGSAITSPAIVTDGPGRYHADVDTSGGKGVYRVRWDATSPDVAAETTFVVTSQFPAPY